MTRYLGLDVGGTNCKLAMVAAGGAGRPELVATATIPTGAGDPGDVLARLAAAATELVAASGPVAAAGVGLPGLFDEDSGRVVLLPNLPPEWSGHEVAGPLAATLGVPVALLNDARAFTLAESRMGAAAGCPTVVCLTLGTGVGGGVVVGGGVAAAGEGLLGPLRAAVAAAAPLVDPDAYEIVPAALGPAAGAIGAALWARERTGP